MSCNCGKTPCRCPKMDSTPRRAYIDKCTDCDPCKSCDSMVKICSFVVANIEEGQTYHNSFVYNQQDDAVYYISDDGTPTRFGASPMFINAFNPEDNNIPRQTVYDFMNNKAYVYDPEGNYKYFALGAGTGGTSDYEDLENKPSINGHELVGDQSSADLGLKEVYIGPTAPQDGSVLWVDTSNGDVPVEGVTLNKQSSSIDVGATETIAANVLPANASDKRVTWSAEGESISIVPNGNACVVTGVAEGSGEVTATTVDGGFTDSCTFTVSPVAVTGVTLSDSTATLAPQETKTLTATIAPENATDKGVTWSKTGNNISIAADGLECVVTAVSDGEGTVTVTTDDGSFTATCTFTVSSTIAVTGVSLDESEIAVEVGESQTLTATITPANATNKTVTWSTSSQDVTLTPDGLTCEVTGAAEGSAVVTVTTQDGSYTDTASVTVEPGVPAGYTKVQYLQGSGTQYIDLDFKPQTGITAKAKLTAYNNPQPVGTACAMGSMSSSSNRFDMFTFGTDSSQRSVWGLGYVTYVFTNTTIVQGQVHEVEAALKNGEQYLKVDGETIYTGTQAGSITASYNMYLYNRIKNGDLDTSWYQGKIYYVQIWQGDTLIRDLVPCLDDQNVPCFYDKANGETYYNAGTGTFIYE